MPRKPTPPTGPIAIPVDPKLKKPWDALAGEIADAIARDASAFDERWEAAAQIVEHAPPLYVFGGYASPAEFFREVLHEAPRNASRFLRVAKLASPGQERTYGVTKPDGGARGGAVRWPASRASILVRSPRRTST